MLDRDHFMNADSRLVARAVMQITDSVQDNRPEAQVLGAAAFFLMVCERYRVSAADALSAITNLMNDREGQKPEFAAVRAYLEHEL